MFLVHSTDLVVFGVRNWSAIPRVWNERSASCHGVSGYNHFSLSPQMESSISFLLHAIVLLQPLPNWASQGSRDSGQGAQLTVYSDDGDLMTMVKILRSVDLFSPAL
jgi:hypothetical protein